MTLSVTKPAVASSASEISAPMPRQAARTVAKNSAANVISLAATAVVSILLPAFLSHHLSPDKYGAWVLILQLSAYVGYLDFGVQTAVSKYIAQYQATQDVAGSGRSASMGLLIMLVASVMGVLLTLALAWRVPNLFKTMPAGLYHDVRLSILLVGMSLSISLASAIFLGIFLGLQRYRLPMVITITSRLLFGAAICIVVVRHGSLIRMGAAAAAVNLFTAIFRLLLWKRLASHIRLALTPVDVPLLQKMLKYCSVLTLWSVCALFISGLDLAIVGRYAFSETAYYAIASAPTSFLLMVNSALMSPLLPATAALCVQHDPARMGGILLRCTRYAVIALLLTGLPLLVGGAWVLRVWVGPAFALHSLDFLRILIAANIVRTACAPYATMVVAASRQTVATASPVSEGLVNLLASIWMARHLGAIGVALGTLLGAVVGVVVHFTVSMSFTQSTFALPPLKLLLRGMLRPAAMAIPSIFLLLCPFPAAVLPFTFLTGCVWAMATLAIGWTVSMTRADRQAVLSLMRRRTRAYA